MRPRWGRIGRTTGRNRAFLFSKEKPGCDHCWLVDHKPFSDIALEVVQFSPSRRPKPGQPMSFLNRKYATLERSRGTTSGLRLAMGEGVAPRRYEAGILPLVLADFWEAMLGPADSSVSARSLARLSASVWSRFRTREVIVRRRSRHRLVGPNSRPPCPPPLMRSPRRDRVDATHGIRSPRGGNGAMGRSSFRRANRESARSGMAGSRTGPSTDSATKRPTAGDSLNPWPLNPAATASP